ncbi:unnamed protein product [Urochloa decumbens]|uniref:Receptor kinase-like protein Xa21 n=1 Tax=Urochloa decumbens TaxID=240449 RepID=A0ABC9DM88_9POAL
MCSGSMAWQTGARLFMALLLLLQLTAAVAVQTDREALLAIKAAVSDPTGALQSWNATANFCRWAGVSCGATARRVTSLNLPERSLTGTLSPAVGNLTHLETLNLTDNGISGGIPASLGRLRRLSYLSLCDNEFIGEVPAALRNCSGLAAAYLNNNRLTGGVPDWLDALQNLMIIRLGQNLIAGRIPPSLANLTKIQRLELDQNFLEGGIPDGIWQLPNLQFFTVYANHLDGEIPPGLFNTSVSLRGISIANNAFRGQLPSDAGSRWPNLQYLFFGGNNLHGPIPASLAMASNLQVLSLANNSFNGQVPSGIGKLCLNNLQLSNNELTATDAGGWEFLEGLANCSMLTEISLDGNKFGGTMPGSIARLSEQLQTLNLGGNSISGVIPLGIGNIIGLQTLDLSSNLLTGMIPEGMGKLMNLQELRLQENKLTGPVPSSIGNLVELLRLDLSNNMLNGSIPSSIGNLHHLTLLNLSGNDLTGHVPRELFNMSSLSSAMDLSDNRLDGLLPPDVGQLEKLALMALSGNRFSGEVPTELGSCQSLEFLYLDNNFFTGSIPPSLSRLKGLMRLNLTSNRLTGSIPPELSQMMGLQELYLAWNDLSGSIPVDLEKSSSLIELDVSYNHLDGPVPTLGVFKNMTGFQMARNSALCGGATQLHLPPCQGTNSTRHAHLLLKIMLPIIGGLVLCSAMLYTLLQSRKRRPRTADSTTPSMLNGNRYPRVSYVELAKATDDFAEDNLIGAGKYGSVYQGILPLKRKGSFVHEDVIVAVKVFDLQQVGASKTFLSECESLRSVRHRNLISIITCCSSIDAKGNEFRAVVFDFMPNYSLDRWLHPSYVDIKKGHVLDIVQRFNIVVDIADAMNYLHNSCEPPIIHCDLKPSNVLLGEDMTAYIGDFGLAKLLLDPGSRVENTESTIGIRGTIGYVAPEYGTSGKVSTHGDVYSFGITLLEIFVGKAPIDKAFRDGLTLPEFVGGAFPEKIEQILDPTLLPIEELFDGVMPCPEENEVRVTVHDCLVSAIRVGLSCCSQAQYQRMGIRDAASQLRLIRDACVRASGK